MNQDRWAGAHYRVERESSGIMMRKRQRRKATEEAIEHGDLPPGTPHDVVRVYDRVGNVVYERDWGADRPSALNHEERIVDDLLKLDVLTFRARYGIVDEATDAEVAPPVPKPEPDPPATPSGWERPADPPPSPSPPGGSHGGAPSGSPGAS